MFAAMDFSVSKSDTTDRGHYGALWGTMASEKCDKIGVGTGVRPLQTKAKVQNRQ
jgi:hypothetical protein